MQSTYSATDKTRIIALLDVLGLTPTDSAEFTVLRRLRGRLVTRHQNGSVEIVADGRPAGSERGVCGALSSSCFNWHGHPGSVSSPADVSDKLLAVDQHLRMLIPQHQVWPAARVTYGPVLADSVDFNPKHCPDPLRHSLRCLESNVRHHNSEDRGAELLGRHASEELAVHRVNVQPNRVRAPLRFGVEALVSKGRNYVDEGDLALGGPPLGLEPGAEGVDYPGLITYHRSIFSLCLRSSAPAKTSVLVGLRRDNSPAHSP